MKNRCSVTIFSLMMLIVLFGFGCNSAQQSNSEKSKTPINAKTKITKDNLKARLSGKKVKFIEDNSEIIVIDRSMPKLKIVSAETPPKVELNGEVYEFGQLLTKLQYIFAGRVDNKNVALAASESDIAFYNKEGISVEDVELLIGNLDEEVSEFYVDFEGLRIPDEISPKSKSGFPSPKIELPKDDEPPPVVPSPSPTPRPLPKVVSGGVLNGKAINLVKPEYSPAAKAVRASGAVNVQVTIDEEGNVISASAVSGHVLLRAAAVSAARASKFSRTMLSGQPVKVTGVIIYNFTLPEPKKENQ